MAAIGCLHAAAVLLVLPTRKVRSFYNPVDQARRDNEAAGALDSGIMPEQPPAPQGYANTTSSGIPPLAPIPVQPLEYTLPGRGQRPAILTVVGVLSIVFASISGLYGIIAGFQGFGFVMLSAATSSANVATPVAVTPPAGTTSPATGTGAPAPPGMLGSVGMNAEERDQTIARLTADDPLAPQRRRQLDAILASVGKNLGTDSISDRGTMPESRAGEPGSDYFVTRTGRLEVFDDRAVFFPGDGTPTVRISVPKDADVPAATQPTLAGGLTQGEIDAIVQQADAQARTSGKALTTQQAATLQSLLAMPGQQLVAPGTAQGSVQFVFAQPNGTVHLSFVSSSSLMLGPTGAVISQTSPAGMAFAPTFSISPWALAGYIASTVLSLGLAALLLVAGIMVLRQSPKGRALHIAYALVKIPVAVLAGVSFAYMMYGMVNSAWTMGAAGGGAGPGTGAAMWTAVPAGLSIIYPIALLIVMNLKSIREYYHSVSASSA